MCGFILLLEIILWQCSAVPSAISLSVDGDSRKEIVIVGLIPTTQEIPAGSIGRGIRPAVQLALDLINNDTDILKDYILKITLNDTECDMAKATKFFFDMMDENTTKIMLFGDACSNVTGPMAQIAKWWNMWQLSYADTDPKLSDRSTYTNFFRTVPSDSDFNPARIALLHHFNWTRVGTIFQDASTGSDRYGVAHHRLIELLDDAGIDVVKVESFLGEPDTAVLHHKNEDVRIIIGFFDHIMARKVFCSAFRRSMYGPKYQWIILGDYPSNWWLSNATEDCSNAEIETAIQGYFSSEALPLSSSNGVTESGLTPMEYLHLYNASRGLEYSKYHGYAFDGVWVIAKAIDNILRHTNFSTLKEDVFRGSTVASALNETNFIGVTGKVQFDGADRIGHVLLQQYHDGEMVKIGEYKRATDELHLLDNVQWRGNAPPRDRNLRRWAMQRVSVEAYNVICFIAGLGIVMATVFLVINIFFRNHRYIKMSSPNMNNVIIVGCILSYLSVFLLGTDSGVIPSANIEHICTAQSWVLSIGFSLSFGAMFSKTWRVHAIFTNIKLNKKIIKDYKLFSMVCVLVLVDAGILCTWQVMDHLYRATKDLPPQIVDEYEVVPVIEYCTSHSIKIWLGILYAYKGLLLVFGSFLAWETKNVNISALNDSKYIGMSVYNVVIMCVCGAAISFIIKDQPTPAFVIISLFIIFSTTITLCLVFVPKLIELKRDPTGEERSIRATLQKKKLKKQENGAAYQKRIRDVVEENKKYKQIIKEKSEEIRGLLEQLGEDTSAYDIDFRPRLHKKVMELRISDMSPGKISRGSSEADNISTLSDTSAFTNTYTWGPESPTVRQRFLFRSTRSTTSTETSLTESVELVDYKKSPAIKVANMRTSMKVTEEGDCLFGGVYCGKSETDNINISAKEDYGYTKSLPNSIAGTTDKMIQAGPGALGGKPYSYRRQSNGQQGGKDCHDEYDSVASITDGLLLKVSPPQKRIRLTTCSPVVVNATIHKQQEEPPTLAWKSDLPLNELTEDSNETLSVEESKPAVKISCPGKKIRVQKQLDDIKE